jgi:hypothetical protein
MDSAGNLYGTTYGTRFSGSNACRACGTVFEISTRSRTETLLHAFSGGTGGAYPTAGLILDGAGNLYGVTQYGGSGCTTSKKSSMLAATPTASVGHPASH